MTVDMPFAQVVAKAIMAIIVSLGGGPVEQGRIGNALSKEERVRSYIKDKHGNRDSPVPVPAKQ